MRRGDEVFAIGATCTHYGGPLAEGLSSGDTVRCPWHHACFDLRTGEAGPRARAEPDPLLRGRPPGRRLVRSAREARGAAPRAAPRAAPCRRSSSSAPAPPGDAAAETLRREGYAGPITMFGAEPTPPVDRPNLSKDYLAGNAPEEWMPLRPPDVLRRAEDRRCALGARVDGARSRGAASVTLADGRDGRLRTRCCSPPAPSRCGCRSPAATGRTCTRCARSPTAARSSQRPRGAQARGRHRRQLHRPRGRGVAARARARGPRRRARGACRSSASLGPELGGFVRGAPRGARRPLPPRADRRRGRAATPSRFGQRRAAAGRPGRARRRRQAVVRAGRGGRPDRRPRHRRRRSPAHQRAGVYAAGDVARYPDRAHRRARPHRALGRRAAAWGRPRRSTSWAAICPSTRAAVLLERRTTTSRSRTSATPRAGTASTSHGDLRRATPPLAYRRGGQTLAVATVGRDRTSLEAEVAIEAGDQATLAAFGRTR